MSLSHWPKKDSVKWETLRSCSDSGHSLLLHSRITSEVYRNLVKASDLVTCRVLVKQTDILVSGLCNLETPATTLVKRYRKDIEDYIKRYPNFKRAFTPFQRDPFAPRIVNTMIESASRAGMGPMATVAGAIAEYVGSGLLTYSRDVIVENGGDIFICSSNRREMLLLAESSEFMGLRIGIPPSPKPIGVCTSSGKTGHSLSFGKADAVTVIGPSASLADAAATAIANQITKPSDIGKGVRMAQEIGAYGILILIGDHFGAWGQIELLG